MGPATAHAEPSGGAYEFARESVSRPGVASGESGRAVTFWSNGSEDAGRVLGRSGPLTSRQALPGISGSGVVAASTTTGRYMRVWAERTPDPCCLSGVFDYRFYSQVLDRYGSPVGPASSVFSRVVDGVMRPVDLAWNSRTRQFLLMYTVDDEGYAEAGSVLLAESGSAVADGRTVLPIDIENAPSVSVAARPKDGTYLVAWDENGLIRGRVLSSTGKLGSTSSFDITRHSNLVGEVANREPDIAVDPATNESLVVWSDRFEVFGRRITASVGVTGPDLRFSRMGPPSDPDWLTRSPRIAYSAGAQQYLVVWQSGPGSDPYPGGEFVYGQHVSRTGSEIGTNDFKISTLDRAVEPAVTSFVGGSDFLAVWSSRRASPSGWARRVTRTP